jgi:hypothetical protein
MEIVTTLNDFPSDVLFKILQPLITEDIYNAYRFQLVNKSFRASIIQVGATSFIDSMCRESSYRPKLTLHLLCRSVQHLKYWTYVTAISIGSVPVKSAAKWSA